MYMKAIAAARQRFGLYSASLLMYIVDTKAFKCLIVFRKQNGAAAAQRFRTILGQLAGRYSWYIAD